jgi:patatin-like phospholipase
MKMRLAHALKRVLPEALRPGEKKFVAETSKSAVVNIVHLIYQHTNYEGHARGYEFFGASMREHWNSGYEDTLRTLRHPEWLGALRDHPRRNDPRPAPRGSDVTSTAGGITLPSSYRSDGREKAQRTHALKCFRPMFSFPSRARRFVTCSIW